MALLISPPEKEIFGSFDAEATFTLDEKAAKQGIRFGIQSNEHRLPIIPFVLSVRPGKLRLIAPVNLGELSAGKRISLAVKAEKAAPELIPGTYVMRLERKGCILRFTVKGPPTFEPSQLSVWDANLSHWIMKRVLLTLRDVPQGAGIVACEVGYETLPKKMDDIVAAKDSFYVGEYTVAKTRLEDIVKVQGEQEAIEVAPEDCLRQAEAHYYLGVMYESSGLRDRAIQEHEAYLLAAPTGQWADAARKKLVRLRQTGGN